MDANVELAKRLIAAFERWDRDAVAEIIDPRALIDVSVRVVDGDGIFHGPDGAMEQFRTWMGAFEDYRWKLEEMIPAGDCVLLLFTESGRGKGSGVPIHQRGAVLWRFGDGRLVEFKTFLDLAAAYRAAGLEPPDDQ